MRTDAELMAEYDLAPSKLARLRLVERAVKGAVPERRGGGRAVAAALGVTDGRAGQLISEAWQLGLLDDVHAKCSYCSKMFSLGRFQKRWDGSLERPRYGPLVRRCDDCWEQRSP